MTFTLMAISPDIIYQALAGTMITLGAVIAAGAVYPVIASVRGGRTSLVERPIGGDEALLKQLRRTGEEGKYRVGLIQCYQAIRDGLLTEFKINYSRADTEREILHSIINREAVSESIRTRLLSLYVLYERSRFGVLEASPGEYEISMIFLEDLLTKYPTFLKKEVH